MIVPQTTVDLIKHWNRCAERMRKRATVKRSKAYRLSFGPMRSHFFFQAKCLEMQADEADASGWRLSFLWSGGEKKEHALTRPSTVAHTRPVRGD